MPHVRVQPQCRRRAVQACVPCKLSKRRCNCAVPCLNCIKRNDAGACRYDSDRPRIPSAIQAVRTGKHVAPQKGPWVLSTTPITASSAARLPPRMMWSAGGGKVYAGYGASPPFLQLLREIFAQRMGPSAFTNDSSRDFMLEAHRDAVAGQELPCQHSQREVIELVDTCMAAVSLQKPVLELGLIATTCGLFGFLHRSEMITRLQTEFGHGESSSDAAIMHAVMAIGAQCRANGPVDQQCEQLHLAKAQKTAYKNMIEHPSIETVQLNLLLGFYLLGACRRNGAFMYIGIAVRAAHCLGLHDEGSYGPSPTGERMARLRTWKTVHLLDLIMSVTIGRPPASLAAEAASSSVDPGGGKDSHRNVSLDAMLDVWSVISRIVNALYKKDVRDPATAKKYLSDLQVWSASLDPSLRSNHPVASITLRNQEVVIGNLHVACSYYYAVMLATRKFLIAQLASGLVPNDGGNTNDAQPKEVDKTSSEIGHLAQTCIDSAILALQTGRDVLDASVLLNQMCILQVWIFAACLTLGFAIFSQHGPALEMQEAYESGQAVLHHLAAHSRQAERYEEILSFLYAAIKEHQRRNSSHGEEMTNSFVHKLFSISSTPSVNNPMQSDAADHLIEPDIIPDSQSNGGACWPQELQGMAAFKTTPKAGLGVGAEGLNLDFSNVDDISGQMWDDLVFENPGTLWSPMAQHLGSAEIEI